MHKIGQRWFSEAEPELGLGIIVLVDIKTIDLDFPAANESRRYNIKSAPLKRVTYSVGDSIQTQDNQTLEVTDLNDHDGVMFYLCSDKVIPEMELKSALSFTRPQDKLFAGNIDTEELFQLRYESTLAMRRYQQFPHKGLLGAKVALLEHQIYLVNEICSRPHVRAMLADEVGLGKTIEAALISKSLLLQNKISRILIIVPDALVYQWFIEFYKKFNIRFHTISDNNELEVEASDFDQGPHYIIGMSKVKELMPELIKQNWDLLIIDEAHRIGWKTNFESEEYKWAKNLASSIPNLLLLSATPEVMGRQGHFARLHLLDPQRFNNYEHFESEQEKYQNLTPTVKKIIDKTSQEDDLLHFFSKEEVSHFNNSDEILKALIDQHGTGRIYFRNTRERMDKEHQFFPQRRLIDYPVSIDKKITDQVVFQHKITILFELLERSANEKVLLITHSRQLVQKIAKELNRLSNIKIGMFHSEQSLMERDRQAAWFADPDGARILLCTEIGSEGRNFEFAHHLFLFDIPKVSEQLEQRIGRLDRIGRQGDILIHVPYIKNTFEELLFHWYHNVIESFQKAPKGANLIYQEFRERIHNLIESAYNQKAVFQLLEDANLRYKEIKQLLSEGHDLLVDLNSFNPKKSKIIKSEILEFEESKLSSYLHRVFETVGVNIEELNQNAIFYKPSDNMLLPSYPGLHSDGLSITYNRDFALKRDDIQFMSWEHPLAIGTMELFIDTEIGNMSIVKLASKLSFNIGFEFYFKLDAHDKLGSETYRYLPITPIRVLVNESGQDLTKVISKKKLDTLTSDAPIEYRQQLQSLPKDHFKGLLNSAHNIAQKRSKNYHDEAIKSLEHDMNLATDRLKNIMKVNHSIDSSELEKIFDYQKTLAHKINQADLALDSLRIIIS